MTPNGAKASDIEDVPDTGTADLDLLFRRYARELNAFAFRRLRDREAAADAVQDGFERFLRWTRQPGGNATAGNPRFFLWTVVGNLTLDLLRRQGRSPIRPLTDADLVVADPAPSAQHALEAREQYAVVKAALDELPLRHRKALLMNRLEGRTHEEISQRLGVSKSMVSKYIMGALELCFIRLAAYRR